MVGFAFSVVNQGPNHLLHQRRHRQWNVKFLCGLQDVAEVFLVEPHPEPSPEIPVQHHGPLGLHHRAPCQTPTNGVEHLLGVDTGLLG